jgi:RNA polymerase sigma-70 factor (ECF subfamily)
MEEVHPHEPALRAYLRGRFPSLQDLDDLVQDTYARVLRARRAGGVDTARPYLFAAARNAALDHLRHREVVRFVPLGETADLSVVEEKPDAAETTAHNQEMALLREAVAALPQRCRQVLILRRYEGRSYAEIARALGISEKTVDAQLCLATFRCREFLVARGVSRDLLAQSGRVSGGMAKTGPSR